MPKIGKQKLLRSVLLELKPPPPPQTQFEFMPSLVPKSRKKPKEWKPLKQIPTNVNPERVISIALRNGDALANGDAAKVCDKNHRKKFSKARREANAKVVGSLASWKTLFDKRRGFASQKDAHSRTSRDKITGRVRYHGGFDEARRGLFDAGLTESYANRLQLRIISGYVEEIKRLEINHKFVDEITGRVWVTFQWARRVANRLYYEEIRPDIRPIFLEASAQNPKLNWVRIEKNLKNMVYFGVRREIGARVAKEKALENKAREESYDEKMERIFMYREDVRELIGKGVQLEYIMGSLKRPSPVVPASFYDLLRPADDKPRIEEPEPEVSEPQVPEAEKKEASRGWREYVSSLLATARDFFRKWLG